MGPDFSIIIPVYNSEQYLGKCIDAIVNQGDYNYEILLVNDGSTDNSLAICNEYAAGNSAIRVFSQENGGLCSARNKGIDNAKGRYLLFIDNDDEIADNTLAVLYNCIKDNDYDIIRFNRKRIQTFPDGSTKTDIYGTKGICKLQTAPEVASSHQAPGKQQTTPEVAPSHQAPGKQQPTPEVASPHQAPGKQQPTPEVAPSHQTPGKEVAPPHGVKVSSRQFFGQYDRFKKSGCFSGIWNALFNRRLFKDIRFDTTITAGYEDFLVNIQAYSIAKKMLFLPDVLYIYYRRSSHSVSTTYKENQIYALTKVANAERAMLRAIPYADEHRIYNSDVNYLGQIIKVLAHRNCPLTMSQKRAVLDNLQKEDGFRFEKDWKKYVKGPKERAYLSLFVGKHYDLLYYLSAAVLKLRHNT